MWDRGFYVLLKVCVVNASCADYGVVVGTGRGQNLATPPLRLGRDMRRDVILSRFRDATTTYIPYLLRDATCM